MIGHLTRHLIVPGKHILFPFDLFRDGGFGVNVFFVISGFLITKLLLEEEELNKKISLKDFYIRRCLRIFPAYYFVLFVYFILQLSGILSFEHQSWFASVFYLKYFYMSDWETGHFWSLSVEEHFYLFWPVVFSLFPKRRVEIALIVIVSVMLFQLNTYTSTIGFPVFLRQESFFLRADAIMMGCLTAIYYEKIITFLDKRKYLAYTVPLIILAIAFFNSGILTNLNYTRKLHLGILLISLGIQSANGIITNLLISLLMVVSIQFSFTVWFKFLNSAILNFIGKLSYSLYLWQQLFFSDRIGIFGKAPLNLLMIFAAALFSYYLIEKPFLRLKNKFRVVRTPRLAVEHLS
jgi:peptidoglycan/LPS O-acetylase OafA/YrhL